MIRTVFVIALVSACVLNPLVWWLAARNSDPGLIVVWSLYAICANAALLACLGIVTFDWFMRLGAKKRGVKWED